MANYVIYVNNFSWEKKIWIYGFISWLEILVVLLIFWSYEAKIKCSRRNEEFWIFHILSAVGLMKKKIKILFVPTFASVPKLQLSRAPKCGNACHACRLHFAPFCTCPLSSYAHRPHFFEQDGFFFLTKATMMIRDKTVAITFRIFFMAHKVAQHPVSCTHSFDLLNNLSKLANE